MKILLAAALTALGVLPAVAADLPVPAPVPYGPPIPALIHSWAACYVGAGGGYGVWNQDMTVETDPGFVAESLNTTAGGRGWFGTVQGGCDAQFADNWVFGAFVDGDFGDLKGTTQLPLPSPADAAVVERHKWAWAVGARLGYIVWPQLLAYVSGGFTQANFSSAELIDHTGFALGFHIPAHTYNGGFIGTGYEYALRWTPGLFWKTEYRYSEYGATDLSIITDGSGVLTGNAIHTSKFAQTIRSELVWRFNWGGAGRVRW
jgi:outer membrane immunogenic protein